jgi:uncharacterized protein YjiS (DUF1127 family)
MLRTTALSIDTGVRGAPHHPVLGAAWRGTARAASRIAAWHRRRREIRRTVVALSQLSDHHLADIGIHRGEIASIAHSGLDTVRDRM